MSDARAPAQATPISLLYPGDKFETLHTKLIGKVVESIPEKEDEEGHPEPGTGGMKVKLYMNGKGWVDRVLHGACLVKLRE